MLLNMVASVDGATHVEGKSAKLGGEFDRVIFFALRSLPDVIMAGAATIRTENYGAPKPSEAAKAKRREANTAEVPRMATISNSLDLDPKSRLFEETHTPPIVFTSATAPEKKLKALEPVAEIHRHRSESVDMTLAMTQLREMGTKILLVEGGPMLNAQLLNAGLIDEVNLTVSNQLVGGDSKRVIEGANPATVPLELSHIWEDGGDLALRYLLKAN